MPHMRSGRASPPRSAAAEPRSGGRPPSHRAGRTPWGGLSATCLAAQEQRPEIAVSRPALAARAEDQPRRPAKITNAIYVNVLARRHEFMAYKMLNTWNHPYIERSGRGPNRSSRWPRPFTAQLAQEGPVILGRLLLGAWGLCSCLAAPDAFTVGQADELTGSLLAVGLVLTAVFPDKGADAFADLGAP